MISVSLRKVCFVLLFALIVAIVPVFLIYGSEFFATFGISKDSGQMLSLFAAFPITLFLVLLWERYILKVSLPLSRQVFLHPKIMMKALAMKIVTVLYAFSIVLFFVNFYGNILALVISISITIASIYSLMVELEVAYLIAKEERVQHPFRQKYD